MNNPNILPDGSAFFTASLPLPKDHWLYQTDEDGFTGPPPMPFRMINCDQRRQMAEKIREAARYAVRASTRCGKDEDFDPDALVQNMVVGMLGYFTADGLGSEDWENPKNIPATHGWYEHSDNVQDGTITGNRTMTDTTLVERLRNGSWDGQTCREAAGTIEKLAGALEDADALLCGANMNRDAVELKVAAALALVRKETENEG